jgi:SAM-dependent methyltransferase
MNSFLRGLAQAAAGTFALPEPILEIGSYQVPGQEALINLRSLFQGQEYLGLDMRSGPGVDLIGDVENLPMHDGSVGTVLAFSTFEHVRRFWKGFEEVRRVLRPDGAFLLCCPFYFHIHNYPADYWRFTPQALELLLADYPSKLIGWHGPRTRPANVWAIALREEHSPITSAEHEDFQQRMRQTVHQPLGWARMLRYLVGRVFCGRRPFAPYLDRQRWTTYVLNEHSQTEPPEEARRDSPYEVSQSEAAIHDSGSGGGRVGLHR